MNLSDQLVPNGQTATEDIRVNPNIPMQDRESILNLWKVINSGKPYAQILEYIEHEIKESVRVVAFNYKFDCFLSDGAYAVSKAIEGKVGFAKQSNSGPSGQPPKMIDVTFADGRHIKVPFGTIQLPIFGEGAFVEMSYDYGSQTMHLKGQCQKRYTRDLDAIVDETKLFLKEDSIYKNQAIRYVEGDEPKFIDISTVDNTKLFLTPEAIFSTQPIEARIEKTAECIRNGIDIKFGVILEGPYGTGKTLYAYKLAKKAIRNNWTFIYCKNAEDALGAMQMAQRFCNNGAGVVLFIEDIDRILNKRDESTNEISLMMDGGESKNLNIITILTTNHLELIDPTFLRGKRIGTIVSLTHPDAETAKEILEAQLVSDTGESMLEDDVTPAAVKIEELQIVPAFISEITDRVKTHQIFSGKRTVSTQDVLSAITTFQRQMDLAKPKSAELSNNEKLGEAIKNVLRVEEVLENIDDIRQSI